jgi:hypothetical protein
LNTNRQKPNRPFLVTLLAVLVLSITTLFLVRATEGIRQWDFLASLPGVSPFYLVTTGTAGAVVGLSISWGLWRGISWAPKATRIAWVVYLLYHWIEKIFINKSGSKLIDWQFDLGLSLISLVFVYGTLSLTGIKAYFGEPHD